MIFPESSCNQNLIERLEHAVKVNRIFHAYIFEGSSEIRYDFAISFIKGICCRRGDGDNCGDCALCDKIDHHNFEDILYIEKDGNSIKDSAIVSMQEKLLVKPYGQKNIVIIDDSETMTLRAQNRLLKVLEEPPGDALIILLTGNMEKLIQTVLSRCVKFRINENADLSGDGSDVADRLVKMLLDRKPFYQTKEVIAGIMTDRDKCYKLLDDMEIVCRNMVVIKQNGIPMYKFDDIYDNIHTIEEARYRLQKGYSPAYTLKNMLLKMGER